MSFAIATVFVLGACYYWYRFGVVKGFNQGIKTAAGVVQEQIDKYEGREKENHEQE